MVGIQFHEIERVIRDESRIYFRSDKEAPGPKEIYEGIVRGVAKAIEDNNRKISNDLYGRLNTAF